VRGDGRKINRKKPPGAEQQAKDEQKKARAFHRVIMADL